MTFDRLLAKSGGKHAGASLQGHTWQVLSSARLLLAERRNAAERTLGCSLQALDRLVPLAAFLHDLGKANDVFQAMVRGENVRQPVRHEALSLLIVHRLLHDWLCCAYTPEEVEQASIMVAGHHRKFMAKATGPTGPDAPICTLLLDHADFANTLQLGVKQLGLPEAPPLARVSLTADRAQTLLEGIDRALHFDTDDRVLAAGKAFLISADVLGSAEPKTKQREQFACDVFKERATQEELANIAATRLGGHSPRPFQRALSASTRPVTLATAGCGSGKTVGAYLWAQQHAGRQLWFCYPTTGTATEGFRDYLVDVDLDTRLEHGRRDVDFDILGIVDGERQDSVLRDLARLEALKIWGSQVVSCTVDTVLGLLQCHRKGMYAWSTLVDAAIVFDEIHAYDDRLFTTLLRWLETMRGTPTLLMTATLPEERLNRLRKVVYETHGAPLEEVAGPTELESLPRYERSFDDVNMAVEGCLATGGKVLWVSNTVARCQAVADAPWSIEPLRYHSRFRYRDRVERHNDVVAAFATEGPCLAVTTQVCEMSLDLSADLLVTDLAPVPALVQRLGRLNRRARPHDAPKPFLVVEPEHHLPYTEDSLHEARNWLESPELRGPCSQRDLAAAWRRFDSPSDEVERVHCSWLDGGFHTTPAELRQTAPSIVVLLSADADAVSRGNLAAQAAALPMNPIKTRDWLSWRRVKHLPVAPPDAISYDELRGGQWR